MDSRTDRTASHDSESAIDSAISGTVSNRTRILAYLGELRAGEFIPVKKLINDLSLRFTTAKNILSALEEEWIVEKKIVNNKGVVALFRISATAVTCRAQPHTTGNNAIGVALNQQAVATTEQSAATTLVPYVPPEWEASYGQHPYTS